MTRDNQELRREKCSGLAAVRHATRCTRHRFGSRFNISKLDVGVWCFRRHSKHPHPATSGGLAACWQIREYVGGQIGTWKHLSFFFPTFWNRTRLNRIVSNRPPAGSSDRTSFPAAQDRGLTLTEYSRCFSCCFDSVERRASSVERPMSRIHCSMSNAPAGPTYNIVF